MENNDQQPYFIRKKNVRNGNPMPTITMRTGEEIAPQLNLIH